ncbi:hypothetical protein NicSoilB4_08110 [Arthrobacter sp. NicSoilB4]|nr:hypothetical protein NicSoilB4_08110 [Arthrobacter sp. NicSoilB4]
MVKVARPKGGKGQCRVCLKLLAQVSPGGLATKHADRKGNFCGGVGQPVVSNAGSKRAIGSGPTSTKASVPIASRRVESLVRSVNKRLKERPAVLQITNARSSAKFSSAATRGEDHWSLLSDSPREDLETDRAWRRVRLGTSQGTGKRR